MHVPRYILPIIVIAQFFCTSLWLAGNGVLTELSTSFDLGTNAIGYLTSSVQFGFILGTLIFALLCIADRFSPSNVFFVCAAFGAMFNLGIIWDGNSIGSIIALRFLTGFCLAGIYPVGMKIASDYFEKGLGKSLGFLVGALVLGTAFPHLLKDVKGTLPWESILITTSTLALLGGILMFVFIPNGPFHKQSQKVQLSAIKTIFKKRDFRTAAFGYFGHMWELYAFWAFVPIILARYSQEHVDQTINIPRYSFLIIAIGAIGCVVAGFLAFKSGDKKIAARALLLSCLCCLISPLAFYLESSVFFLAFLLFWGIVVIADSPLFSTLVAKSAPKELKGTALTITNSIGFFITILSIELISWMGTFSNSNSIFMVLAIGPILSLIGLFSRSRSTPSK